MSVVCHADTIHSSVHYSVNAGISNEGLTGSDPILKNVPLASFYSAIFIMRHKSSTKRMM